jgi:transketolase
MKKLTSEELAWLIRRHGIEMTHLSHGSHIGAILSVADIMAVLYTEVLRIFPDEPKSLGRDYFILSKGHAGAAVYSALAERGFFDREILKTHYQNGSILSGHVSHKTVPGVDASTGSLGHGLSYGVGIALALKKLGRKNKVYVVLGDGECDEGAVWEAILAANEYKLDNLVAIVDRNRMQSLDFTENTVKLEPFLKKWQAFNWNAIEIDGNNIDELRKAFIAIKGANGPSVIVADTTKGKGISFMENNILWHYRFPHDGEEYDTAIMELEKVRPAGIEDPYNKEAK